MNRQEEYLEDVKQMIATAPKCPVRISEQITNVMATQWHRGSDWALGIERTVRGEVVAVFDPRRSDSLFGTLDTLVRVAGTVRTSCTASSSLLPVSSGSNTPVASCWRRSRFGSRISEPLSRVNPG